MKFRSSLLVTALPLYLPRHRRGMLRASAPLSVLPVAVAAEAFPSAGADGSGRWQGSSHHSR